MSVEEEGCSGAAKSRPKIDDKTDKDGNESCIFICFWRSVASRLLARLSGARAQCSGLAGKGAVRSSIPLSCGRLLIS